MSVWTDLSENGALVEGGSRAFPYWGGYGIRFHTLGDLCIVQKFTVLTDFRECDSMIMEVETMVLKIYTIFGPTVEDGAEVQEFTLSSGIKISAILVGEKGRGRELGVLPVVGVRPGERIYAAQVGQTSSGKPKLLAASPEHAVPAPVILVLRTGIGFRGSNSHEGEFMPIVRGIIAQGIAGRMGCGEQLVVLLPEGKVLKVRRSGRLYGAPPEYHYLLREGKILVATPEEREITEIF